MPLRSVIGSLRNLFLVTEHSSHALPRLCSGVFCYFATCVNKEAPMLQDEVAGCVLKSEPPWLRTPLASMWVVRRNQYSRL